MFKKALLYFITAFLLLYNNSTIAQKAVLSSRWFHPVDKYDTLSTATVLKAYKPDRVDWAYAAKPEAVAYYRQNGIKFSVAMNPSLPDSGAYTTQKIRIKTINNKTYVPSWYTWGDNYSYWGCVNNPEFQKLFTEKAISYIDNGAYGIFVDDALFNVQLQKDKGHTAGCVCNYCIAGFKKYFGKKRSAGLDSLRIVNGLKGKTGNNEQLLKAYKEYQEHSVVTFLKNWRNSLKAHKKNVVLLTNNYRGEWNDIYSVFDGGIAEIHEEDLTVEKLDNLFKQADRKKKKQVFSLVSNNEAAQDYLIAYLIYNKRDYLIPWDIYLGSNKDRYFGNQEHFVKLKKLLLDKNTVIKISEAPKSDSWYYTEVKNGKTYFIIYKNPKSKEESKFIIVFLAFLSLLFGFLLIRLIKKKQDKVETNIFNLIHAV